MNDERWIASVTVDRQSEFLGTFDTEEDAARAYDRGVLELVGPGAKRNFSSTADEEAHVPT